MTEAKTRCIECGGFVGSLNEDEDGLPCPACAERLLETLPGVFHQSWTETVSNEEEYADSDEAYAEGSSGVEAVDQGGDERGDRGRFGK